MEKNTQTKKILIVEDEDDQREVLADEFKDQGFEVLIAKNGKEGLEVSQNKKPDLILLDIVMPVMDGISMMTKLRKDSTWGKEVPIILLTNLTSDSDKVIKAVSENDPAYYLVKSDWDLSNVVEKTKECLE